MRTKVSTVINGNIPLKLGDRHRIKLADGRRVDMIVEGIDLQRMPGMKWITGTALYMTGVDVSYPPEPVNLEEVIQ